MKKKNRYRPQKSSQIKVGDSLESMVAKLGARQNSVTYMRGLSLTQDRAQLISMWLNSWLSRKICDRKARDMTRKWREVKSNSLTAEQITEYERLENKLNAREVFRQATQWASLFGTGAVLIITDKTDKETSQQPLGADEKVIRLMAIDRHSMSAHSNRLVTDIFDPDFGSPELYNIKMNTVHRSRLIIIKGREKPLSEPEVYWGISDLEDVYETIKRFDIMSLNIGELVQESKLDIFKMDGYSDMVSSGLEDEVLKLLSFIQATKSLTNSLVLDTTAEYEQKEQTFTGLRDILVEFRNAVAGAADMPVTILFGQSASGFASGEEDIKSYYDSVNSLQESRLRPALERLDNILCNQLFGLVHDDWWFTFMPLHQLTETERMTNLNVFSQAIALLIQNGVIREDQAAEELKQSTMFDKIGDDDIQLLKEMNNEPDPNEFSPIAQNEWQENQAQQTTATNNPQQTLGSMA